MKLRLDAEAYEQGACFSLVLITAGRRSILSDNAVAELCIDELRSTTERYSASVYAYCLMPDHAHLLVAAPEGVNLVNVVRHFKQMTSYRFRQLPRYEREALWQRRFYDHALRQEEDLTAAARYIWGNPVRAGLVSDYRTYPYSGTFVWGGSALSGSEDPDLHPSANDPHLAGGDVGEGLQTLARAEARQK